jgi:hypothetical protein
MLAPNQPDEKQSSTYHPCAKDDPRQQWQGCRDQSQLIDKVKDDQRVEDWK